MKEVSNEGEPESLPLLFFSISSFRQVICEPIMENADASWETTMAMLNIRIPMEFIRFIFKTVKDAIAFNVKEFIPLFWYEDILFG